MDGLRTDDALLIHFGGVIKKIQWKNKCNYMNSAYWKRKNTSKTTSKNSPCKRTSNQLLLKFICLELWYKPFDTHGFRELSQKKDTDKNIKALSMLPSLWKMNLQRELPGPQMHKQINLSQQTDIRGMKHVKRNTRPGLFWYSWFSLVLSELSQAWHKWFQKKSVQKSIPEFF